MKHGLIMAAAGLLATGGMLAKAGIALSKHDFRNEKWANGEICLPCHAPHGNQNAAGTLLWNHTASFASYTFYSSPSMRAEVPAVMSDISKTCMGCHDGTVAVDSFGGKTGGALWAETVLGTRLGNDHPISIPYNWPLQQPKHLRDPSSAPSGLGGTIANDMLYEGKVECNSCHDTHNTFGIPKMLKKSNADSALCLTCHDK